MSRTSRSHTSWLERLSERRFFFILFTLIGILFHKAFAINFFLDDYFFLRVGRASSVQDFLLFFSPVKSYFYRPIPTELFYFIIHLLRENLFISHLIVFSVYFIGIYFSYRSLLRVTKDQLWSRLAIGMYAISFIHVFQLYQLATFIEVALFTFLSLSAFFFLHRKLGWSLLCFVCACMSKETAILFPLLLLTLSLIDTSASRSRRDLIWFFGVSALFTAIYKFGVSGVVDNVETYRIQMNPRLGLNNLMWYSFWSLGAPNFMPVYFTSIFKKPVPDFWKVWQSLEVREYFGLLAAYLATLVLNIGVYLLTQKKKLKPVVIPSIVLAGAFVLFISPTLLIVHKWMVRLTVPLFFLITALSYPLANNLRTSGIRRMAALAALTLYIASNIVATPLHESSSTFLLQSRTVYAVAAYLRAHAPQIRARRLIYFRDPPKGKGNPWGGSAFLKNTLHDQNYAVHFFPGVAVKTIYGFEHPSIPKNAVIIPSISILTKYHD